MANNLTTAQRAAFVGPTFDVTRIRRLGQLFLGATTHDVTAKIFNWGSTRVEVLNLHPARKGQLTYPPLIWSVINDDGMFSPGYSGSIFFGTVTTDWTMRFELYDELTVAPPGSLFSSFAFPLKEVQLNGQTAQLIGLHPLARHWARRFKKEDRHDPDWGAINHDVTI